MWPGVSSFPDYKTSFPKWPKQELKRVVKQLNDEGIDLLEVGSSLSRIRSHTMLFMLVYCASSFILQFY